LSIVTEAVSMKVSLTVLTAGKMQGQSIPIKLAQFLIGRDRQCHLRPANPLVSNRHCAVLIRSNKVFLRDFRSTNGTFVNEERLVDECELHDADSIRVGPLHFGVNIEADVAAAPPVKPAEDTSDDEAAAALLMSLQEETATPHNRKTDESGVPTGTTIMEAAAASPDQDTTSVGNKDTEKKPAAKATEDTSAAANSILQKYLRRPRKTT
jgi:pSer/pThr/pTyr-binding forkhead associated (FHA) protein